MKCEIIRDLLPLYVDECCSEASTKLIETHLEGCPECGKALKCMRRPLPPQSVEQPKAALRRIDSWRASLLQSVMLFASFALMTLGVVLEGNTPKGQTNGLWAVALIIPATGYLLSLANWYFLRLYKSRKTFSGCSCAATLAMTAVGYLWAVIHYADGIHWMSPLVLVGAVLTLVFCVLSKVLSNQYALLLGRE